MSFPARCRARGDRWRALGCIALTVVLLAAAGCYLASGERTTLLPADASGRGEISGRLVSADGSTMRELQVGPSNETVAVELTVEVERGELTLEILSPEGNAVLAAAARYGRAGRADGVVRTDEAGRLRYRLSAREAGNGRYTIRYRSTWVPTPTPTALPAP